jgi:hypothetical protein
MLETILELLNNRAVLIVIGVLVGGLVTGVTNFFLQRSQDRRRFEHERVMQQRREQESTARRERLSGISQHPGTEANNNSVGSNNPAQIIRESSYASPRRGLQLIIRRFPPTAEFRNPSRFVYLCSRLFENPLI